MGSNWAQEFRRRVEESEGKYRATEDFDDVDEFAEEEEEAELEELEDEAEEEIEGVEQEPDEAEIEKLPVKPIVTLEIKLERESFRRELENILGSKTDQATKREVAKAEAAKREANEWASVGAAMMGLVVLSLMSTLYQTMSQAFQPLIQSFGSRSYGSQQWVTCPYCGYQCLGYDGMPCPRCGRS